MKRVVMTGALESFTDFADNGLPPGFHAASAELYQTLSPLKDKWEVLLEEGLELLGERADQTYDNRSLTYLESEIICRNLIAP